METKQIIKTLSFFGILFFAVLINPAESYGRTWVDAQGDVTLTNSPDSVVVVPAGTATAEKHSTIYNGNLTINAGVTLELSQYSVFHFCLSYSLTGNGYIRVPAHDNRRIVKQCLPTSCGAGAYVDSYGRCWRAASIGANNNCTNVCAAAGATCVEFADASYNDDSNCSICKYFHPDWLACKTLGPNNPSYLPYFYNYLGSYKECTRRNDAPQYIATCGNTANQYTARLCVCSK